MYTKEELTDGIGKLMQLINSEKICPNLARGHIFLTELTTQTFTNTIVLRTIAALIIFEELARVFSTKK